jgi:hypothetical protein
MNAAVCLRPLCAFVEQTEKALSFYLVCSLNYAFSSVIVICVAEKLLYSKHYDFALGFILCTCAGTGVKRGLILE